jgi:glycerol-3-phosphate acyltransferase PlsX
MIMSHTIKIALDCMGGDHAPLSIIEGASIASKSIQSKAKFIFFGDEDVLCKIVKRFDIESEYEIHHCDSKIPSDLKPSSALRGMLREYKNSSMVEAVRAVREKTASVAISAGNTGALMAISRMSLGMLTGIDRPAIVTCIPNEIGREFVILDLGANIGANTDDLLQLALMGAVFGKIVLKKPSLRLSLLNIGEEEIKGNDVIKNTYQTLKKLNTKDLFNFVGYTEPHNIFKDLSDIIVCDGFIGNITLKTMEGTANMIKNSLTKGFQGSFFAKIGYLLAKNSLKHTMSVIDPRNKNGAMLIGLNGIVVKSHGSADCLAFSHAMKVAYSLSSSDINSKIAYELEQHDFSYNEINNI